MLIENQQVNLPILQEKEITLYIKREDVIHPFISGNKYRKLKYNLVEAKAQGCKTILTYGGAFSNHIAAMACAGKENKIHAVGIIRGDELKAKWKDNPTLLQAHKHGMEFDFVSREQFRDKKSASFTTYLREKYDNFYALPEGGTNSLAVKGCEEILQDEDAIFNVICCPVGTGGTIAGVINASKKEQQVIGFSALKGGEFLKKDICKFANKENWSLQTNYHFGGYAKVNSQLIHFINEFKEKTEIQLDPIYTAKMMFGIIDSVKKDKFAPQTKILALHTGGLQGIEGMNQRLKNKGLPLID